MCGIVGIVRNDGSDVDQALLGRMCAAIRHRGPDDDGFYFNGPVGLGMRRLAIIDSEERTTADSQSGPHRLDSFQRRDLQLPRTPRQTRKTRPHLLHQQRHRSDRSRLRSIWRRLSQTSARNVCLRNLGRAHSGTCSSRAIASARSHCSTRRSMASLFSARNSARCCSIRTLAKTSTSKRSTIISLSCACPRR